MVNELLAMGYDVTIATRGRAEDCFGDKVKRVKLERTSEESMRSALQGQHYDVVIDKLAYCSNDVKYVMEAVSCDKYICMSTTSVYEPKHMDTQECEFDALGKELIWCDRKAFPYAEIKRQAECALWQKYGDRDFIAVRYPFVIGKDDYTKRLQFYVEHVVNSMPMYIDNPDAQMGFIRSDEAGKFLAFLADKDFNGAINGSSAGTISMREVVEYVESKTGKKAVLSEDGDKAPYNSELEYSINTEQAAGLGYQFSDLKGWIYELLDYYISCAEEI